jgi:dTDP-4-dehydrorhamnose 3,5-epimerase
MQTIETRLPGVAIFEPNRFGDQRGFFMETFQRDRYAEAGLDREFVQDNFSRSCQGVLRGLHYQMENPQGKLVTVMRGEIYDVALDMREYSNTFGEWVGVRLSGENGRQLYIPPGFAHGFCVLSEEADFHYKCTDFYDPASERSVVWNSPELQIDWPIEKPVVSEKDQAGEVFAHADRYTNPLQVEDVVPNLKVGFSD